MEKFISIVAILWCLLFVAPYQTATASDLDSDIDAMMDDWECDNAQYQFLDFLAKSNPGLKKIIRSSMADGQVTLAEFDMIMEKEAELNNASKEDLKDALKKTLGMSGQ